MKIWRIYGSARMQIYGWGKNNERKLLGRKSYELLEERKKETMNDNCLDNVKDDRIHV